MESNQSALLGALFWINSMGAEGLSVGEIMLNHNQTSLPGILFDPFYREPAVAFTYPRF